MHPQWPTNMTSPHLVRLPDPCYSIQIFIKQIYELRPRQREQSCNKGQVREGVSTGKWKWRRLVLEAGWSWHLLVAKIGLPWPSSCSRVVFPSAQSPGRSREWSIFLFFALISIFSRITHLFFAKLIDFLFHKFLLFRLAGILSHFYFMPTERFWLANLIQNQCTLLAILCWTLWLCHRLIRNKPSIFVMNIRPA